jgi:hypothetical protein
MKKIFIFGIILGLILHFIEMGWRIKYTNTLDNSTMYIYEKTYSKRKAMANVEKKCGNVLSKNNFVFVSCTPYIKFLKLKVDDLIITQKDLTK